MIFHALNILSLDRIINPFLANHLFAVKGTQWHFILFANFRHKLTLISCCAVLNVSHPASIFWVQPQTLLQKQILIHVVFFVFTSLASDSSIARVWVCHLFGIRTLISHRFPFCLHPSSCSSSPVEQTSFILPLFVPKCPSCIAVHIKEDSSQREMKIQPAPKWPQGLAAPKRKKSKGSITVGPPDFWCGMRGQVEHQRDLRALKSTGSSPQMSFRHGISGVILVKRI